MSVVTPVYNGDKFLRDCIESVLGQVHTQWEHVILDNASTDETPEIAAFYASRDPRIRVRRNERTLPMVDNWNRALALIADESRYCKVLHADDAMYPQCLSKMVALATAHPTVGVVGSLRLRGETVECGGLADGTGLYPGKEVARLFLRQEVFAFAPTAGMIRSDLVRSRAPAFYPAHYLHADLAGHFELLDRSDFGLVDEVLLLSRVHEDSVTTTLAAKKQTILREWLSILQEYGPRYFAPDELSRLEQTFLRRYYRLLVRAFMTGRGRSFFDYHLDGLRAAGRVPKSGDICLAVAAELGESVARPLKLYRYLRERGGRSSGEARARM